MMKLEIKIFKAPAAAKPWIFLERNAQDWESANSQIDYWKEILLDFVNQEGLPKSTYVTFSWTENEKNFIRDWWMFD